MPTYPARPTPRRIARILTLLLLTAIGVSATSAAPLDLSPRPPAMISRLVILNAQTRWDAWSQAVGPQVIGSQAAGSHGAAVGWGGRASADAATARAAAHIAHIAAPVAAAVESSGGRVIQRYDTALAGLLVHVPTAGAAALDAQLRALPGVRRVVDPPLARAQLKDSAPGIGAARVRGELGIDGRGATIAVIDTGVDYTHAAFGGPGTEDAYAAARMATAVITDTWQGAPFFPNARVIGGWDFAGPNYAPGCTPVGQSQDACSIEPVPDPDPLDTQGHGTHVTGIAAGQATGPAGEGVAVGEGVAPGAGIVALKIFGDGPTTDLLVGALEWVVEANLGDGGRPHIDVVNLSLGIEYGAQILEDEGLIRRATEAGIVVVASAGNDDNLPFIVGAPAIAPEALAVASHLPPGQHVWNAEIRAGTEPPLAFDDAAIVHQRWSPDPRQDLAAPLVYVGRGCPGGAGQAPDPFLADPRGAIALFEMAWGEGGESCTAENQVLRLQAAGAVSALMGTSLGVEVASRWSAEPSVDIPVWMVNGALEQAVIDRSTPGAALHATLLRVMRPAEDGVVSDFSSRGPARTGRLKPDLSAPGSGIVSAAVGQGRRGVAASGTSMASPHAAGTAALVWAAARAAGRSPTAREVAARILATADPDVVLQSETRREPPPIARSGAGGLDAWAAVAADTTVRAGPIASLSWGVRALRAPIAPTQVVTLTNHAASARRYRLGPRFRMAEDLGRGLDLRIAPAELELAPGASGQITVTAAVSPALLPPWDISGGDGVGDLEALGDAELDGWIEITAIDAATGVPADPSGGDRPLVVPFHLLARRASDIAAEGSLPQPGSEAPTRIELANPGAFEGSAELFTLLATDPSEPAIPPKIDLDAVGVRTRLDREGQTVVEFLLHARGARMHPLETESLIELDTDRDGGVDYRVYTVDEELLRTGTFKNGKVVVALASRNGDLIGVPAARFYAGVDLNSRYTILPIVIDDTGLTAGTLAFNFRVQARDLVERDLRKPLYDQVPDRAPGGGDRWLAFDGRSPAWRPERASVRVPGGGEATIRVQPGAAIGPGSGIGLALLFPANEPAADLWLLRPPETFELALPALFRGG